MRNVTNKSKLWWLVKADEVRPERGIVVVDALKLVVDRFRFVGVPTGLPAPNEGYVFREGSLVTNTGAIAIEELTIFSDGISIQTYSTTDDSLSVLSAVLFLMNEIGFRKAITPPTIVLQSQITFDTDANFDNLAHGFELLRQAISEAVDAPIQPQLRTVEFTVDPSAVPNLESKVFRLERRVNERYSTNRWFSFANATTEKHLALLKKLEQMFEPAASATF